MVAPAGYAAQRVSPENEMRLMDAGGTLPEKMALFKLLQSINALSPIVETVLGITSDLMPESQNAHSPMVVRLVGSEMLSSAEQLWKA